MYSGMADCTSQAKAMLNNKKTKLVALAIVELHYYSVRQAVSSQSVSKKNSMNNFS